jgi:hypothetical protein
MLTLCLQLEDLVFIIKRDMKLNNDVWIQVYQTQQGKI